MNRGVSKLIIGLFSICSSTVSIATLQVIADLGGESAIRFYEPIQPVASDNPDDVHPNAVPSELNEADLLPIVTHLMRPGRIEPKRVHLPGMQTLFLIGDDRYSRQWLATNQKQLVKLNATGLVVQVEQMAGLASLRAIAGDLPLLPVSADDLAQRLHITAYPLIISEEGIYQ